MCMVLQLTAFSQATSSSLGSASASSPSSEATLPSAGSAADASGESRILRETQRRTDPGPSDDVLTNAARRGRPVTWKDVDFRPLKRIPLRWGPPPDDGPSKHVNKGTIQPLRADSSQQDIPSSSRHVPPDHPSQPPSLSAAQKESGSQVRFADWWVRYREMYNGPLPKVFRKPDSGVAFFQTVELTLYKARIRALDAVRK